MKIDISRQIKTDASFPLDPGRVYTGSAFPVEVVGVPCRRGDAYVTGVKVAVTNADGLTIEATAVMFNDGSWRAVFAASCFTSFGRIDNGLVVSLDLLNGGTQHVEKIGCGIFEVMSGSPDVQPGDPTAHYRRVGDDDYRKSYVLENIQHYKKVEIAYDEDMGDWGFNLTGDFILSADGEFIPYSEI